MLAYSGKGRFVAAPHDISEIVREMGQILSVSVSKKATIRYSLAEGLPAVKSDATQIRQVIMNLITNASEALGGGAGVINLAAGRVRCGESDGNFFRESLHQVLLRSACFLNSLGSGCRTRCAGTLSQ